MRTPCVYISLLPSWQPVGDAAAVQWVPLASPFIASARPLRQFRSAASDMGHVAPCRPSRAVTIVLRMEELALSLSDALPFHRKSSARSSVSPG